MTECATALNTGTYINVLVFRVSGFVNDERNTSAL